MAAHCQHTGDHGDEKFEKRTSLFAWERDQCIRPIYLFTNEYRRRSSSATAERAFYLIARFIP